jgi:hypothetical protein
LDCGAQRRTWNFVYFSLVTDGYFAIKIKKRSRKRSYYIGGEPIVSRMNFKLNRAAALAEWRHL